MKKTSAKQKGNRVKVRKLKLSRETVRKLGKHELGKIKGGAIATETNYCAGDTRSVAQDGTASGAVKLIVPSIGIR